ncbi:Vacuolar sorting-associated protein 18 [Gossypium australe]|uniref:Vacuolar sorting-associated protein 18 n=1 Tax=Gossypium australe TaxID=47621 RepID=A0A5B6TP82_9ROSI|nr:Vacuolar sorting-associated protein 18 [Gossypium australe]
MAPFSLRSRLQASALSKRRLKSKAKHVIIIFFGCSFCKFSLPYLANLQLIWGSGRKGMKNMEESFKRLKSEMEEISEEQKNIREGQRQVKLALMFRILKAREAGELNAAATLTEMLRLVS